MASPNQLLLLADHIKLSLLERLRAQSLNIDGDSKDGHISRSLDQFRDGLAALLKEKQRLEEAGDDDGAQSIADNLPDLQKQYDDLTSQFHGFSSPSTETTITRPNDASLAGDFEHAASFASSSKLKGEQRPTASKTVRFTDNPTTSERNMDLEAQLFGNRYTDNPNGDTAGYRDEADSMDNQQIHAYHQQILDEQDAQLDALGQSIARQRELSMQIGDELDDHVAMLDETDRMVDRHQGRLDRARRQVGKITRSANDNKQIVAIILLIVILILLIVILK